MVFFFYHLYHTFAGLYDLVAYLVSLGQWKNWVSGIIPYITGHQILEIGFGPGHLLKALDETGGFEVFGLDESRQMAGLAARRLHKNKRAIRPHIIRARAESMPYASASFDSVAATFPTPYIAQPDTIRQILRVLKPGGRLVLLLAARHPRDSFFVKLADGLFAITGQAPPSNDETSRLAQPFQVEGFDTSIQWESSSSGKLLLLIASKPKRS